MECYDRPDLWDFAFSDETEYEADFIQQTAARWLGTTAPKVLEIGCGGGRQTVELCRRGLEVSAFDLNPQCVQETQRQLRRR
ncbi:MAG: class I SAM-dependent methyltransferase, partial [Planctomycetaceae bacterium]